MSEDEQIPVDFWYQSYLRSRLFMGILPPPTRFLRLLAWICRKLNQPAPKLLGRYFERRGFRLENGHLRNIQPAR